MKVLGTDYDGVIINIEPQKAEAFADLLNKEWGINKNAAKKFWLEKGGTSRRYTFDYFYEKRFANKLFDKNYIIIERKYADILKNNFYPYVKLLPGALELLKFARATFDHTFVSSGVPMEELRYLVGLNGVEKYFDLILGTNAQFTSKQEHFKLIKAKWNPDKTIFIGDSPEDMKRAKEADAIPLGVLTNHSKEKLIKAGAKDVCFLPEVIFKIKTLLSN